MALQEKMQLCADATEAFLAEVLGTEDAHLTEIYAAMRYSVMAGGKRVRPFLVLESCRMLGGDLGSAMFYAGAIEMLHTYSLIHDDLPCMDNDDMRRGKPTNHKVFGEAMATLAGDGLLTGAFELLAAAPLPPENNLSAVKVLSAAAGAAGMVGGQAMDLAAEEETPSAEVYAKICALKTGALFRAAVLMGAAAAGVTPEDIRYQALLQYAECIGLAFQLTDDLLDKYGDEAELGKGLHRDEKEGKTTFLTYCDKETAKAQIKELTATAMNAIQCFEGSEMLLALAEYLQERTK